jgi:hypothetical protein
MKSYRRGHSAWLLLAILFVLALPIPCLAGGKKVADPKPANQYPAYDSHPLEHVSIAIDPCTEQRDCDFFRLPYIRHSMIPVRVIITNDSDSALDLSQVRMQFIARDGEKYPAANLDDLNRRLFSPEQAVGRKVPIIPIPIPIHHPPIDKKIVQDDDDFGFKTTTVAAHSTISGYLFYDIKDLDNPALKGAEIYVKMIHTAGGKELFGFSIPFDKWLTAQKISNSTNDVSR